MNDKKKPNEPEPTLEVPAYNPALDSANHKPLDEAPPATYPLLDLDEQPPPPRPPAEQVPEKTMEIPPLDLNPARRKAK